MRTSTQPGLSQWTLVGHITILVHLSAVPIYGGSYCSHINATYTSQHHCTSNTCINARNHHLPNAPHCVQHPPSTKVKATPRRHLAKTRALSDQQKHSIIILICSSTQAMPTTSSIASYISSTYSSHINIRYRISSLLRPFAPVYLACAFVRLCTWNTAFPCF